MKDTEIKDLDTILNYAVDSDNRSIQYAYFRENGNTDVFGFKDETEGIKYFYSLLATLEFFDFGKANGSLKTFKFTSSKHIVFKKQGGFKSYYENLKKTEKENSQLKKLEIERQKIKDENDILTNSALKHEETIRNQKQRILDLEEEIKVFSLLQKYWWVIGVSIGVGIAVREFLF